MGWNAKKKLLYLVTEDWFFCSHFIERAVAAQKAGYDVVVVTHLAQHAKVIRARGLRIISLDLDRGSTSPRQEFATLRQIIRIYRAERPDFVHQVALKPVLYGSIAAWLTGVKTVINAPVGMGYIFISSSIKARLLRLPVKACLKIFLSPRHGRVIFENADDLRSLVRGGYVRAQAAMLIRGAGIDLQMFVPQRESPTIPTVILTARMLWDKGIGEFVEAARLIKATGTQARFLLVGAPDPLNHANIHEACLRQWHEEGVVEWLGHRSDIDQLLAQSHIVCLPSYREGLPKSLLEALAAGKPVVTTDVQGCREVVTQGVNGFLVPVRDAKALAQALTILINDPQKRVAMGRAGRVRAENEFSQERVIAETLAIYGELEREITLH